jgi:hypothetical protein
MDLLLAIDSLKLITASFFVVFAGLVFYKVRRAGEKSMVSFELAPEKTKDEYRIMLYANIMVSIGLLFYFLSDLFDIQVLLLAGKLITAVYALTIGYVISRWVRRFDAGQ